MKKFNGCPLLWGHLLPIRFSRFFYSYDRLTFHWLHRSGKGLLTEVYSIMN